jgi:hypothetical protein
MVTRGICAGTWPYGPPCAQHLRLGGLSSANGSTNWHHFAGRAWVLGFGTRKRSEARFILPEVQNGEQVTELEGEKWQRP